MALLAGALLAACGAPRDPDLERRAMLALSRSEKARSAAASEPAGGAAAVPAEAPAKTYSNEEIQRVLGAIPGSGPILWAELRTSQGTIRCKLDEQAAPQTVTNFVGLAAGLLDWQDQKAGTTSRRPFYDGLTFHRIVANFIIQSGNPSGRLGGGPGWALARESGRDAYFDGAGALAMVDAGPNSNGSQFFITARPDKNLKSRYVAFGQCDNVDLVKKISAAEKMPSGDGTSPTVPKDPVKIFTLKITRGG
ncbi:MAG: peptidylprolyl isomerase [Deltaproteobacteria bacterium]|nr:peptidylprolyl isomerase [Deltaproteobacteria bacterium]